MATFSGTALADLLVGSRDDDTLLGLDGDDWLFGRAGNDVLDGGAGCDRLVAGPGGDYLVDTDAARAWGGAGDDQLAIAAGSARGGAGNDVFQINYAAAETVTWRGGSGADIFLASFYSNDGHAGHVTITDFRPGQGDQIRLQEDDQPSGYHADGDVVAQQEDTNHDGKLSALQPDGSGDLYVTQDGNALSIHYWEDTLTIAHMAAIDLSLLG